MNTEETLRLPLLVTRGMVLFPNIVVTIDAARPFSMKAIEISQNECDSLLLISAQKNPDDAEDVVQETFLRYHTYKKDFESKEHIESWLYKVAINKAKDIQRKFWKRNMRRTDSNVSVLFLLILLRSC